MATCTGQRYVGRQPNTDSNFAPCTERATKSRTEKRTFRVVDGKLSFEKHTVKHLFCAQCASDHDSMMAERAFERKYS